MEHACKLFAWACVFGLNPNKLHVVPQGVEVGPQALLDHLAGVDAYVDTDPPASKVLGRVNGCATTAEGIKYRIAFIGTGCD